jgi:aminopeptidase C
LFILVCRRYVYQVVIPEKLAESKYVEILKSGNPSVLPLWDALGALA